MAASRRFVVAPCTCLRAARDRCRVGRAAVTRPPWATPTAVAVVSDGRAALARAGGAGANDRAARGAAGDGNWGGGREGGGGHPPARARGDRGASASGGGAWAAMCARATAP